jgi:2-(1,2-epoxy-1,2-dihydrophenyl)acetyl-CoA isomerase
MDGPTLLTDCKDGVLTLSLNRPAKRNAIDNALAAALLQALEDAAGDAAVRAIRLRGEGPAFCAGRDVGAPPTDEDLELVQAVAAAIVRNPKPVVAAVQGWAVGAGLEWMLTADIAIAAADARFRLPEAGLGVFVTGGLSATLTAAVGLARAKALVLTGEPFDAAAAHAWGLVWRVVEPAELDAASAALAATLARLDPAVATRFKRVFNDLGLALFERAIEEENAAQRFLQGGGRWPRLVV